MKVKINFQKPIHKAGRRIVRLLAEFETYWVGGTVRDLILKREIDNLDIATSAHPDVVETILNKAGIDTKPVGKKFGTILAIVSGFPIEITTFRVEGRYSDKRHPDKVTFIDDYKVDAKRRDFTINSLYLDIATGQILDSVNGLQDIEKKLIRFVGKAANRIDEDSLRMIRAVRFSVQLNFKLESNTFAAIKTRAKFIQKVAGERLKPELDKILLSKNKITGIRLLDSIGLLAFIIPDFPKLKTVTHNSNKYHLEGNVFDHTLLVTEQLQDLSLIYAGLFHDLGKASTKIKKFKNGEWVNSFPGHGKVSAQLFNLFATRMRFSRKARKQIEWLIIHHDDRINFEEMKLVNKINYVLNPSFDALAKLWMADSKGKLLLNEKDEIVKGNSPNTRAALKLLGRIRSNKILIDALTNGEKIMDLWKVKPGPKINKIRLKIIELILLNKIKTKTDLKKYILEKNT